MARLSFRSLAILPLLCIFPSVFAGLTPIRIPVHGAKWFSGGGSWSATTIRVGTPPQWVNVLVSTASSETWVISNDACTSGYFNCVDRGGVFNPANSSSWNSIGEFELGLRPELKDVDFSTTVKDWGYGQYGQDVIRFDDGIDYPNQVIAAINDTTYMTGMMGLSVKSPTFYEVGKSSFLSYLFDSKKIPSRSWGYTAGASYRLKKVPTDVVLGGKNLSRYRAHNISFSLDPNQNPVATIESITVQATGNPPWGPGPKTLLLNPILAIIDSSTPFLWLPEVVCNQFEQALGLVWDPTTKLYLLQNTTIYNNLRQLNLTWTFTLTDLAGGLNTEITVPYSALDLQIGLPFVNTSTEQRYFPLKRATRDQQFTLGRAFLQEAYLIVDYERKNFSVSQAVFEPGPDRVVAIIHPTDEVRNPSPGPGQPSHNSSKGLPRMAIIGIAAGVGLLVIVAIGLVTFFLMKKKKPDDDPDKIYPYVFDMYGAASGGEGRERVNSPQEMPVDGQKVELEAHGLVELPADELEREQEPETSPDSVQEI